MEIKDFQLLLTFLIIGLILVIFAGPTIYRDWRNSKKTDLKDR